MSLSSYNLEEYFDNLNTILKKYNITQDKVRKWAKEGKLTELRRKDKFYEQPEFYHKFYLKNPFNPEKDFFTPYTQFNDPVTTNIYKEGSPTRFNLPKLSKRITW